MELENWDIIKENDLPNYNLELESKIPVNKQIGPINFVVSIGNSCTVADLIRYNNAKSKKSWDSFMFDWAQSNIDCVCDVIKNGLDWHIKNNIISHKEYDSYIFKKLFYPRHEKDIEWQIKCAKRFFKLLESNYNVVFLYMCQNVLPTTERQLLPIKKLSKLENILLKKYPNLNFKIVGAVSINKKADKKIVHTHISDYIESYECDVHYIFEGIREKHDSNFYTNLFNIIVPYELDIKDL